jgi:hypothetical protein
VRVSQYAITGEQHLCGDHAYANVAYQAEYYGKSAWYHCKICNEEPYELCYQVYDDRYDGVSNPHAMFLRHAQLRHVIRIEYGILEASALYNQMHSEKKARLTHALMNKAIQALGGRVTAVVLTDVDVAARQFQATIRVRTDRDARDIEIEARPSDAIALGVACQAEILVKRNVIKALFDCL